MTDKVIAIIISVIVAIAALAILWFIFNDLVKVISEGIADIMFKIKCSFCEKIGILSNIGRMCEACT